MVLIGADLALAQQRLEPGSLTVERLGEAATAAGFHVRGIRANIPSAVRSRLAFTVSPYDDKQLTTLRERYQLEKVIAPARDKWMAQLLLKEWVHKAIPGGEAKASAHHALDILELSARGETFWCTYYSITYMESALASYFSVITAPRIVCRKFLPDQSFCEFIGLTSTQAERHR